MSECLFFSIPSSPPGWQARSLVCDWRVSCLGELGMEPEVEVVGEGQQAETPRWRWAGCWHCSDLLPQVYRREEVLTAESPDMTLAS